MISFNLAPGLALGNAVTQIQNAAATTLPDTISLQFQGAAQAFQDSLRGLGVVLHPGHRRDLYRARRAV